MENPDFRMLLADRLYALTAQGAPLDDAVAQARLRDITAELAPAMVAESARWGDVRTETPITPDDWAAARADVLAQMDGNGAKPAPWPETRASMPYRTRPSSTTRTRS
ncbi:MAG: hypothetical protein R2851_11995 [Caldilineaceae bacterium]